MHRAFRPLALALALLTPGLVLAHGKNGVHLLGVVQEARDTTLVVQDKDGKRVEVLTDASTMYEKSGAAAKAADLVPGEKVVVHAERAQDGQLHAQLVKFGKQPKKASSAAPAPH